MTSKKTPHMYLALNHPEAHMDFGANGKIHAKGGVAYFTDAQHEEFQTLLQGGRLDLNSHFRYVDQAAEEAGVKAALARQKTPEPVAAQGSFTTAMAEQRQAAEAVRNPQLDPEVVIPKVETGETVVDLTPKVQAPIFGAAKK